MPVNKQVGKLWFKTQEEIDAYDDLMLSNIRLKDDTDFDSPSYSLLAARSKKEKFFEWSKKGEESLRYGQELMKNKKPDYGSYSYFRELSIYKYIGYYGLGYLLLRELPIRRFYARSIIMALLFLKSREFVRLGQLNEPLWSSLVLVDDGNYSKQFDIYENAYNALKTIKPQNPDGMNSYSIWKLNQPGSCSPDLSDWAKIPYFMKKEQTTFWDGTMNQPLLPLADPKHKDMASYYWI